MQFSLLLASANLLLFSQAAVIVNNSTSRTNNTLLVHPEIPDALQVQNDTLQNLNNITMPQQLLTLATSTLQNVNFDESCKPFLTPLNVALKETMMLAMKAAANLQRSGSNPLKDAWFGKNAQFVSDAALLGRFQRIATFFTESGQNDALTFTCDFQSDLCNPQCVNQRVPVGDKCSRDPIAATRTNFNTIGLCNRFFKVQNKFIASLSPPRSPRFPSAPLDEYRTWASFILHEMTHALFGTADVTFTKNGQVLPGYGQELTLRLAASDADGARRNADNYAMFSVATFFSNACVSTNPDNLLDACLGNDL